MMTSAARQPVLEEEHDHRDVDHQAISQRVGVLPELRFDPQPPRQPAVHLIGDRGGGKDDGGRPAVPLVSPRQQHHEDRYEREPRDRQRIWQLRDRGGDCAGTHGTRIVATRLRARKRPCPGARPRDRPRDIPPRLSLQVSKSGENPPHGANADPARLRQRSLARVPAGATWTSGGSRLLGLAGDDARRGGAPDAAQRGRGVRARLSRAARRRLHRGG